jgi:Cu(I)/Ag(I) efflux system membrane protein CusA/SilA
MLVYLNNSLYFKIKKHANAQITNETIKDAIYEGAVQRLRPKLMTVLVDVIGLLPVLVATGAGSDVMKPITIPFVFGLLTSTIFVLIVLPVIYAYVRERELHKTGTLDYKLLGD